MPCATPQVFASNASAHAKRVSWPGQSIGMRSPGRGADATQALMSPSGRTPSLSTHRMLRRGTGMHLKHAHENGFRALPMERISVDGWFAAKSGDLVFQHQFPALHFRDLERIASRADHFTMDLGLKSGVATLKLLQVRLDGHS